MSGENGASTEAKTVPIDDGSDGRERSTIGFPYNNLTDATEVAQAIYNNVGTGECEASQLAAWLNLSHKSSGFRVQLSAARQFGLVESNALRLTELGRMIVDPQRGREARAKAFLNIPLYKVAYEKYKGGQLPPAAAFERDIVGLGVAEKQKERARQVFERSAEQAGYFESGKGRLVMPGFAPSGGAGDPDPNPKVDEKNKGGGGGGGGGAGSGETPIDPIIQGLLARLPKSGDVWPDAERKLWLQLLEGSFKLIFRDKPSEPSN